MHDVLGDVMPQGIWNIFKLFLKDFFSFFLFVWSADTCTNNSKGDEVYWQRHA